MFHFLFHATTRCVTECFSGVYLEGIWNEGERLSVAVDFCYC